MSEQEQELTYVLLHDDERIGKAAKHKDFNFTGFIVSIRRWSDGTETFTMNHEHGGISANAHTFVILS